MDFGKSQRGRLRRRPQRGGDRHKAAQHSGGLEELGYLLWKGSAVAIANEGGRSSDVDVVELALKKGAGYVALLASRKRATLIIRGLKLRTPAGRDRQEA